LAGMMILIYTMIPNSPGLFSHARKMHSPAFSIVHAFRWFIVATAVLVIWPVSMLSAALDEQMVDGHLSDWLSCALFALSAAQVLHHWAQSARQPGTFPTAGIFWLCVASVLCVQIDPIGDTSIFPFTRSFEAFGVVLNARLILLALCCLGAAESLRARGNLYRAGAIMLAFAGVLSAILSAYSAQEALRWGYFAAGVVGLTTFASLAHALPEQEHASESLPAVRAG
ncbi:MAG TPA: hypothetical protein VMF89_24735, partial [Polyangiales bacterium]|nr:hypothetical protein [Polyangiales bacterium]